MYLLAVALEMQVEFVLAAFERRFLGSRRLH
jgi:hypothetical protein